MDRFFFDDLAETNEAKESQVLSSGLLTKKEMPHIESDLLIPRVLI